MKLGVFGPAFVRGKAYDSEIAYEFVARCLSEFDDVELIVTGGGKGVEQLAIKWAVLNSVDNDVTPPNIKQHGFEKAFVFRNQEILAVVDFAALFWDGKDASMYRLMSDAVDHKKRLMIIPVE